MNPTIKSKTNSNPYRDYWTRVLLNDDDSISNDKILNGSCVIVLVFYLTKFAFQGDISESYHRWVDQRKNDIRDEALLHSFFEVFCSLGSANSIRYAEYLVGKKGTRSIAELKEMSSVDELEDLFKDLL